MNSTPKDRLCEFISYLGISISQFEKKIGLSNGVIGHSKGKISNNVTEKAIKVYPQLNPVWLMTGDGDMIRQSSALEVNNDFSTGKHIQSPHTEIVGDSAATAALQAKIDGLKAYIENRFIKERSRICSGWLQAAIYEFVHGEVDPADKAHRLLSDMCEKYPSSLTNPSDSTIGQYNMMAELLRRYACAHAPLYIDTMTDEDIEYLVEYMREERIGKKVVNRSQNTINTKLKKLHAVLSWCKAKKKLITSSPFDTYTIDQSVYGDPTFLTIAERDKIYAYKGLSAAKEVQRDIFIFHCYIGCRISDLLRLKKSNIVDRDGIMICDYSQKKLITDTKDVISVPLSSVALEILDKYKDLEGDQLLPFISAQKYNDYIKEILREIGIDRTIVVVDSDTREIRNVPLCDISSSHLARRTFTQHVFSATKSERIAAELTGHKEGSTAMKRYTKMDDAMRKDVIGLIDTKKADPPSQADLPI